MYFWQSLFGTLRAFSCKLSLKRSLCRIGAGGSASRGAMGLPAARQRVCRQGEAIRLMWCTRGRSNRMLANFRVCRRPCTERDLVSISSYVMTGDNQKLSVSGYKSSDRSSKPILRGKHSLSESRKVSAFGLPVVPRSPLLACIAPIHCQQHRGLNGESKLPKQKSSACSGHRRRCLH